MHHVPGFFVVCKRTKLINPGVVKLRATQTLVAVGADAPDAVAVYQRDQMILLVVVSYQIFRNHGEQAGLTLKAGVLHVIGGWSQHQGPAAGCDPCPPP